jgi:hypothetical protein
MRHLLRSGSPRGAIESYSPVRIWGFGKPEIRGCYDCRNVETECALIRTAAEGVNPIDREVIGRLPERFLLVIVGNLKFTFAILQ